MNSWRLSDLLPGVEVRVEGAMPALPPAVEAEVERHWRAARHGRPDLFNGQVFSVDHMAPDCILGHWTEYRRVLAQFRAPELHAVLGIRSLAVCGLLRCAGGAIVLGRRNPRAVYMPGRWQLVPAGNVDPAAAVGQRIALERQFAAEFVEELGLPVDSLRDVVPLCAVQHPGSHVIDIVHGARTTEAPAAIVAAHEAAANRELIELQFTSPDATEDDRLRDETMMPLARLVLRRFGRAGLAATPS